MAAPDVAFDLGCGWLHSGDKNSFVKIAAQLDFEIDKTRPPWREQSFDIGFPPRERADFIEALDAFYDRADFLKSLRQRKRRDDRIGKPDRRKTIVFQREIGKAAPRVEPRQ